VITCCSPAYLAAADSCQGLTFVPPGDPQALADAVAAWAARRAELPEAGRRARALFEQVFDGDVIRAQLTAALGGI